MRTLKNCGKLLVQESPIEGFGVFATQDIKAGEILEEVPFILFPRFTNLSKDIFNVLRSNGWINQKELHFENLRENLGFKEPEKYYFKWHPRVKFDGDSMYTVLPLGFGPIYNTSNTDNNADWKIQKDTFIFSCIKDVAAGEEIRTFYGYFLGENGSTYNCETVFHLAIDMFPREDGKSVHKVKSLRFGSLESVNQQRHNPAANEFNKAIAESLDGVTITSIRLSTASGDKVADIGIPEFVSLSALYQKLAEVRAHPAPIVTFALGYLDKDKNVVIGKEIIWKK